jgi:hypothetical protein
MASRARLTITVTSNATSTNVQIRSSGKYKGLITNEEAANLSSLPLMTTASESAFWTAVLPYVQSNV